MPIRERGGSFQVTVGSGENRYRQMFPNKEDAERAEMDEKHRRKAQEGPQVARKAVKGLTPVVGAGKTLQDAYELTTRLHWKGEKAEKTNSINAGAVLAYLGRDTLLADITAEEVNEMVFEFEDKGNSGSTVNKKASCLRMMFKTAVEQKWIKDWPNPPFRRESKHRIRWMDDAEERKVLELCEHLGLLDLKDYIQVAIDTGFRRGELLGFKSKDFSNGLLHLHAGSTKNDEARTVPATRRVTEILTRRGNRPLVFSPLTVTTLRSQWERVRGLLGLDGDPQFVVHMLRHTCASRLVQRGVPLVMVQKWMGHLKIETTLRYAHLAPDSLLIGRDALEPVGSIVNAEGAGEVALEDF